MARITLSAERAHHRPQVRVPFPRQEKWESHGPFERYALWPRAGTSFESAHWTAYYRWSGGERFDSPPSVQPSCCHIFVCRGELEISGGDGRLWKLVAGDFACGRYSEAELATSRASSDLVMVVKYQVNNLETAHNTQRSAGNLLYIPYFYGHGGVNNFRSALLHGTPFGKPTNLVAIVRFPEGASVSSHYHDDPIFHEFIYLQGGHMTPDGYYATGDHVTSIPGCKEGPWLATYEPRLERVPVGWPRFAHDDDLAPDLCSPPWPKPFVNHHSEKIYGLLFVHGGPFVNLVGGLNWHVLGEGELGPGEECRRRGAGDLNAY